MGSGQSKRPQRGIPRRAWDPASFQRGSRRSRPAHVGSRQSRAWGPASPVSARGSRQSCKRRQKRIPRRAWGPASPVSVGSRQSSKKLQTSIRGRGIGPASPLRGSRQTSKAHVGPERHPKVRGIPRRAWDPASPLRLQSGIQGGWGVSPVLYEAPEKHPKAHASPPRGSERHAKARARVGPRQSSSERHPKARVGSRQSSKRPQRGIPRRAWGPASPLRGSREGHPKARGVPPVL